MNSARCLHTALAARHYASTGPDCGRSLWPSGLGKHGPAAGEAEGGKGRECTDIQRQTASQQGLPYSRGAQWLPRDVLKEEGRSGRKVHERGGICILRCVCLRIYAYICMPLLYGRNLFSTHGKEKARIEIAPTLLCLPHGCLSYTNRLIIRVF